MNIYSHHIRQNDTGAGGALGISLLLHGLVLLLSVMGLPWAKKTLPQIVEPPSIAVEFVSASKAPVKKDAVKKAPSLSARPKKAPTMKADVAPDLSQVKAPPVKRDEPPPLEQTKTVPLPQKAKKIEQPDKKPDNNLTKRAAVQDNQQFSSLLKNLMETPEVDDDRSFDDIRKELNEKSTEIEDNKAENARSMNDVVEEINRDVSSSSRPSRSFIDSTLNMSEISAVKQQLAGCWNVLSGARYAENLTVEVILYMNSDRTVRDAVIADKMRYNRDKSFRAAADSAIRALRMERCRVLNLPLDKYDQWKKTTITFDPREML